MLKGLYRFRAGPRIVSGERLAEHPRFANLKRFFRGRSNQTEPLIREVIGGGGFLKRFRGRL